MELSEGLVGWDFWAWILFEGSQPLNLMVGLWDLQFTLHTVDRGLGFIRVFVMWIFKFW